MRYFVRREQEVEAYRIVEILEKPGDLSHLYRFRVTTDVLHDENLTVQASRKDCQGLVPSVGDYWITPWLYGGTSEGWLVPQTIFEQNFYQKET